MVGVWTMAGIQVVEGPKNKADHWLGIPLLAPSAMNAPTAKMGYKNSSPTTSSPAHNTLNPDGNYK